MQLALNYNFFIRFDVFALFHLIVFVNQLKGTPKERKTLPHTSPISHLLHLS